MKQKLSYQIGDGHIVTGEIPVSHDNFIFTDIEEHIVFTKSDIIMHYDKVMSTLGDSYKGASKYAYDNILQAINTIIVAKNNRLRRSGKSEALGIFASRDEILSCKNSENTSVIRNKDDFRSNTKVINKVFVEKSVPAWIEKFLGGNF